MKEIKYYQCEFCGTKYDTKEEAKKCENYHNDTVGIMTCDYQRSEKNPVGMRVKMDDGTEAFYRLVNYI